MFYAANGLANGFWILDVEESSKKEKVKVLTAVLLTVDNTVTTQQV